MKRRIFDNGITTISYCPAGASASETVIVTFAEMGPVDVERPGFGELFLNKRGYDVISVQKRKENWYQDLSIDDLKQAVSEIIGRYKTVFTYGSSMGGYAALYFASAVGGRALSFSPRHHSYYALVGMHAYANQFEPNHLPLQDVADPSQEHLILVDPLQPIDGPYVLREIVPSFPNSTILNLRYTDHPSTFVLAHGGVLQNFVVDFIEGRPINERLLRSSRGKSPQYLHTLAKACFKKGRTATAMALCQRALSIRADHKDSLALMERMTPKGTLQKRPSAHALAPA